MTYRTRTYIAGDWTGDENLISKLYEWNENERLNLSFTDAHELMQARDDSLPCSIKKSLAERLNASKNFVLIVGEHTDRLTKGSCFFCHHLISWIGCERNNHIDLRSYVLFECEKAVRDDLNILVLYNSSRINKKKCPEAVRDRGIHLAAYHWDSHLNKTWNYQDIKNAIMSL